MLYRNLIFFSVLFAAFMPLTPMAQPGYPDITSPDGIPAKPVAEKLRREHWGLKGPVKSFSESTSLIVTEEDKKLTFNQIVFNDKGWVVKDEAAGVYGHRWQYVYEPGIVRFRDLTMRLDAAGRPVSSVSPTTQTSYTYKGDLLTGINISYRGQVEQMDGTMEVISWKKSEKFSYDAAGRLTEKVELHDGKEQYRVRYRYNAAGKLDSLIDQGVNRRSRYFTFSYETENGKQIVNYFDRASGAQIHYKTDHGRFEFDAGGRLLFSRFTERNDDALQKQYFYDQYGNWTEIKISQHPGSEKTNLWNNWSETRTITYY